MGVIINGRGGEKINILKSDIVMKFLSEYFGVRE